MTDKAPIARTLCLEYIVRTEEFDRTLPGYFHKRAPDEWVPLDAGASSRHAKQQYAVALELASRERIPRWEFDRVFQDCKHVRYTAAKAELGRP